LYSIKIKLLSHFSGLVAIEKKEAIVYLTNYRFKVALYGENKCIDFIYNFISTENHHRYMSDFAAS